jgi:hypothetical protein
LGLCKIALLGASRSVISQVRAHQSSRTGQVPSWANWRSLLAGPHESTTKADAYDRLTIGLGLLGHALTATASRRPRRTSSITLPIRARCEVILHLLSRDRSSGCSQRGSGRERRQAATPTGLQLLAIGQGREVYNSAAHVATQLCPASATMDAASSFIRWGAVQIMGHERAPNDSWLGLGPCNV